MAFINHFLPITAPSNRKGKYGYIYDCILYIYIYNCILLYINIYEPFDRDMMCLLAIIARVGHKPIMTMGVPPCT